jgi:hypothetical protein
MIIGREQEDCVEYVYAGAATLQRKEKVGDGDCVALIQKFTSAGVTTGWRQGDAVLNNKQLRPGTAIATFFNGRYPRLNTGNHAAFFLRHGIDGFWIIDQYAKRPLIQSRFIEIKGKAPSGALIDPSNNALAFSVIETK